MTHLYKPSPLPRQAVAAWLSPPPLQGLWWWPYRSLSPLWGSGCAHRHTPPWWTAPSAPSTQSRSCAALREWTHPLLWCLPGQCENLINQTGWDLDQLKKKKEKGDPKMSAAHPYQLLLNGQDTTLCSFTVCLLPGDDNHLWVAILSRQINFGVCFLSNLQNKMKGVSNQTKTNNQPPNNIRSAENVQYLLDVRPSFSNDVSVELLEDGDRDGIAVLHLTKGIT